MDIIATGMVCSVGLTAVTACAAMRARIVRFEDLPYADNHREPIVGAVVPGLGRELTRRQRLIELSAMALEDCLESSRVQSTERIPLLVGLAEPGRPGGGACWSSSIVPDVEAKLQVRFDPERSTTLTKGHTAGFEALRLAREILHDHDVPACLVCGVDSYINASSLLWLERHWRLKTTENSDGVIPGEAAACALVVRDQAGSRDRNLTRVLGLGFAHEPASVLTEEPLLGLGLAQAARSALAEARLPMHEIHLRLSDVTGESYGFKEQALSLVRILRVRKEEFPIWHCSDAIGDTGAASGACQLVIASEAFARGYAPGNRTLCYSSSVGGDRAVVAVESSPTS